VSPTDPDPATGDGADNREPDTSTRADRQHDEERLRQHLRDASTAAFRRVEASAPPSVGTRMRALREGARGRRSLDTAWRMGVLTLGATLLTAGALMFVLPGPGFATVILGLVVLGSEFTWATRVLDPVRGAARRASEAALDPRRRRRNLILGGVAGVIAGIAVTWYLVRFGMTIGPLFDWAQSVVERFLGLFD
jgi:uncharacterized protein (TIGR02611 family)